MLILGIVYGAKVGLKLRLLSMTRIVPLVILGMLFGPFKFNTRILKLSFLSAGTDNTELLTLKYPRSLNISLHLIISEFARRRQSLKSKCSQIITNQVVRIQIDTKHRAELSSISRVVFSRQMYSFPKRQLQGNS